MPLWCDFCRDTGYSAEYSVSLRGSRREKEGMEKECVAGASLLDCDDGDGGVADCVGAVEGEDFVEFFADG